VIKKTLSPVWNQDFSFKLAWPDLTGHSLTVTVFDWDFLKEDGELGEGAIDVASLEMEAERGLALSDGVPCECTVHLDDGQLQPATVLLTLRWVDDPGTRVFQSPPVDETAAAASPVGSPARSPLRSAPRSAPSSPVRAHELDGLSFDDHLSPSIPGSRQGQGGSTSADHYAYGVVTHNDRRSDSHYGRSRCGSAAGSRQARPSTPLAPNEAQLRLYQQAPPHPL
jgi:hypothetical protein